MTLARRLGRGSVIYLVATVLPRGLAFFLLPLYTRLLSPEDYGTLTVVTALTGQGDPPDLQLEIFTDGKFSEPADRSDQDMQSNSANESVSVNVRAGQAVHVKVTSNFSRGGRYRLSSSLAP